MKHGARLNLSFAATIVTAVMLLLAGAGLAYLFMPGERQPAGGGSTVMPSREASQPSATPDPPIAAPGGRLADVIVPLSKEMADRAGIEVTPVSVGVAASTLRMPGTVEPNAYKQVVVTPIAGGRVTRVAVELGERVRRGQALARIYSPDLAEAQTRLVALRAEFDAVEQQVNRTRRLVEIGAASRQELEQVHAQHAGHAAALAGARSRLILLGMSPGAIDGLSEGSEVSSTITVPAPLEGIVTERMANAGLNVDPSTELFKIVDLRNVWVVGDLYERDFSRVHVGDPATVTTAAYPNAALDGRVGYIDPVVNPETRTARVRVEVANPRQELRLGMLAQIEVRAAGGSKMPMVPREAVQTVGGRQVVYLTDPSTPGRFVERDVQVGERAGQQIEVLAGLSPGDVIVTKGSFFVRAERERLGLRPGSAR